MNFGQARPPLWRTQVQKAVAGGFGANGAQQPAASKPYTFGTIPKATVPATATQGLAGAGNTAADMAKQAMAKMMTPTAPGSMASLSPLQIQQAAQAKSMTQGITATPSALQQPAQQLKADLQSQAAPNAGYNFGPAPAPAAAPPPVQTAAPTSPINANGRRGAAMAAQVAARSDERAATAITPAHNPFGPDTGGSYNSGSVTQQRIAPTVTKPLTTNMVGDTVAAQQHADRASAMSATNASIAAQQGQTVGTPKAGMTTSGDVSAGIANRQQAPTLGSVAGQVAGAGQTAQDISNSQIAKMAAGGGYQVERDNALFKQASGVAADQMAGNLPKGYGAGETSALDLLKQQQAQRTRATQESLAAAGIGNTGKAIQEGLINTGAQNDREVMGMQRDQLAARTTAQQAQIAQGQIAAQNLSTMAQQGQQTNAQQIITGAGVAGDLGLRAGAQRADATQTDNTNATDIYKTNNDLNQKDAEREATISQNALDRKQQTSERVGAEGFSAAESEKGRALTKLGMSSNMLQSIQDLVDAGSIDPQTASDMMGQMLNGMSAGNGGAQVYDPTTAAANRATQKTADDATAAADKATADAAAAAKVTADATAKREHLSVGANVATVNTQGYGLDSSGKIIGYKDPVTGMWQSYHVITDADFPNIGGSLYN